MAFLLQLPKIDRWQKKTILIKLKKNKKLFPPPPSTSFLPMKFISTPRETFDKIQSKRYKEWHLSLSPLYTSQG